MICLNEVERRSLSVLVRRSSTVSRIWLSWRWLSWRMSSSCSLVALVLPWSCSVMARELAWSCWETICELVASWPVTSWRRLSTRVPACSTLRESASSVALEEAAEVACCEAREFMRPSSSSSRPSTSERSDPCLPALTNPKMAKQTLSAAMANAAISITDIRSPCSRLGHPARAALVLSDLTLEPILHCHWFRLAGATTSPRAVS